MQITVTYGSGFVYTADGIPEEVPDKLVKTIRNKNRLKRSIARKQDGSNNQAKEIQRYEKCRRKIEGEVKTYSRQYINNIMTALSGYEITLTLDETEKKPGNRNLSPKRKAATLLQNAFVERLKSKCNQNDILLEIQQTGRKQKDRPNAATQRYLSFFHI